MCFELLARRIVQLFIKVVGELGEQSFAGSSPVGWGCGGFRTRAKKRFPGGAAMGRWARQLFADKKPCPMKTYSNVPRPKAGDVADFFVGQSFHIAQDQNDAVLRRQLLNHFAQAACLLAADGE